MAKNKETKETKMAQNQTIYKLQAEICAALASPVRLHILDLLSDGEKTATDLLTELKIPKANLSQHIAVLKDAGIIQSRKEGLFQYLSLSLPTIKEACGLIRSVLLTKVSMDEKQNLKLIKELRSRGKNE